jgi:hypothetical protein
MIDSLGEGEDGLLEIRDGKSNRRKREKIKRGSETIPRLNHTIVTLCVYTGGLYPKEVVVYSWKGFPTSN